MGDRRWLVGKKKVDLMFYLMSGCVGEARVRTAGGSREEGKCVRRLKPQREECNGLYMLLEVNGSRMFESQVKLNH